MRFLSLLVFLALSLTPAQAGGSARGVVELFTSQGCSDCPPADKALGVISNRGGVITLAWHVDYWNYLGWRDTFSSGAFTGRQRAYGFGVYTPQFVVNGSRASSNPSIAGGAGGLPVSVSVKRGGGKLSVSTGGGSGSANLYVVSFINSANVAIQRGENRGRTVNYRHAVTGIRSIGSWNGKASTYSVPGGGNCAVILQRGGTGAIIGAAMC
jgi:hypothetical protein